MGTMQRAWHRSSPAAGDPAVHGLPGSEHCVTMTKHRLQSARNIVGIQCVLVLLQCCTMSLGVRPAPDIITSSADSCSCVCSGNSRMSGLGHHTSRCGIAQGGGGGQGYRKGALAEERQGQLRAAQWAEPRGAAAGHEGRQSHAGAHTPAVPGVRCSCKNDVDVLTYLMCMRPLMPISSLIQAILGFEPCDVNAFS